jgi:hypothetical protein
MFFYHCGTEIESLRFDAQVNVDTRHRACPCGSTAFA